MSPGPAVTPIASTSARGDTRLGERPGDDIADHPEVRLAASSGTTPP